MDTHGCVMGVDYRTVRLVSSAGAALQAPLIRSGGNVLPVDSLLPANIQNEMVPLKWHAGVDAVGR